MSMSSRLLKAVLTAGQIHIVPKLRGPRASWESVDTFPRCESCRQECVHVSSQHGILCDLLSNGPLLRQIWIWESGLEGMRIERIQRIRARNPKERGQDRCRRLVEDRSCSRCVGGARIIARIHLDAPSCAGPKCLASVPRTAWWVRTRSGTPWRLHLPAELGEGGRQGRQKGETSGCCWSWMAEGADGGSRFSTERAMGAMQHGSFSSGFMFA